MKLTAYAKFGKLRVDVDPNLPKAKYWRFTIQRLGRDGVTWSKWRTLRTTTKREVRSVNPPKGTYRVVVPEQRGYRAAVSVLVTLKR